MSKEYTPNVNGGTIFKNNKRTGETSPDYVGLINVSGDIKRILCYVKEARNGEKYFSVKLYDPKPSTT